MADEATLRAEYTIGLEAEVFMKSDLGRYLQGVSEQEVNSYKEQLAWTDPEDAKAIREIQTKIHVAKTCLVWLEEAITRSYEAEEQLKS